MGKKITIGIILGLAIVAGGFWYVQRYVQDDSQEVVNNEQENIEVVENEDQNKINQNQEIENKEIANQEKKEIKPPNTEDWRTAKWITYKDKKNGFEVKYPDSYFISIISKKVKHAYLQEGDVRIRHSDTVRYRHEITGPYDVPETNLVEISVRDNENKLSLIEWVQKNDNRCIKCINNCNKFDCNFYRMKMVKINKKNALMLSEPSIMDNEAVYFNLGNKIVEFHGQGVTFDSNNGDNFFRKMMESFKIIN